MKNFVLLKGEDRETSMQRGMEVLSGLSKDTIWCVFVKDNKPTRTDLQNNLLWALYTDILRIGGEAMQGYTKEELHEFFLGLHFGTDVKSVFGKYRETPKQRSSKLNRKEFSEFVDHIVRFMAEQGVVLELPGDLP